MIAYLILALVTGILMTIIVYDDTDDVVGAGITGLMWAVLAPIVWFIFLGGFIGWIVGLIGKGVNKIV